MINNPIIYKFFKDFTKHRKTSNWAVVLSSRYFSILKYREQDYGKQDSFRHLLKSSANMWERFGWQFFRTTIGIQSGLDAFQSRFIMTFLTILGVTEILCSFKLVLEGKTGKELPESSRLDFLEKFLANNFARSDT